MAFLHSYFDESGKFKDHRVISFCGVATTPESLEIFNREWDSLLRANQMTDLHAMHALRASRSLSPVISRQSVQERIETLKPFVDCIVNNLDFGMAVAIDVEGFSKWSPDAKKKIADMEDPAYLAFLRVSLMLNACACREDDHIMLVCDDDSGTAWHFYLLYRRIKRINAELRKKFVSISFADDSFYPALQAADFIAALVRLESLSRFEYHPYDYSKLFQYLEEKSDFGKMKWQVSIANRDQMIALGNGFEKLTRR